MLRFVPIPLVPAGKRFPMSVLLRSGCVPSEGFRAGLLRSGGQSPVRCQVRPVRSRFVRLPQSGSFSWRAGSLRNLRNRLRSCLLPSGVFPTGLFPSSSFLSGRIRHLANNCRRRSLSVHVRRRRAARFGAACCRCQCVSLLPFPGLLRRQSSCLCYKSRFF